MAEPTPAPARYEIVDRAPEGAPWLALVHGVSQDRRTFDRQVAAFADGFRLLLIDLPGHGLSSDLPGPYGAEGFAAAVEGALDAAGVDEGGMIGGGGGRCHLWATHLGASAALLIAARRPALFASLILEGPVLPGRPLPVAAAVLERVRAALEAGGIAAAREVWWHEGPWFDIIRARPSACRAAAQRAIVDGFQGAPWRDAGLVTRPVAPVDAALAALDVPALVYNGEHDHADFLAHAEALAALLPRGERAMVPGGGGFPL